MATSRNSSDFNNDSTTRGKGTVIVKPIVYGNTARAFPKKREEDGHTHNWTVYVRPYENEDMSLYVRKVQFKLHESYTNPLRTVANPPYEIQESGWGEFEVVIKIFFQDVSDRPITFHHHLKLFQSETNIVVGKRSIVYESYDEMIFQDPSPMMQPLLRTNRQLHLGHYKHPTNFKQREEDHINKLEEALTRISSEIHECKESILKKQQDMKQYKAAIEQHEKNQSEMLYDMDGI